MQVVHVTQHIVKWLREYVHQSKTEGFIVGVSGGVDSAVTSALAAGTGLPVICVEMPIYQNARQVSRAFNHIRELRQNHHNVKTEKVDLSAVFDSFLGELPDTNSHEARDKSLVNVRARLRMTALYYFAGLKNYLVVGTGNKVEDFGVGFFTKYGDGGVDLSPIADLTKTEVYDLGKYLGVNPDILVAPPTDGLWGDDRTDEDQLGATYPELEWAMEQQQAGKTAKDFEGRQKRVMEIYLRQHRANRHKMLPIPVCEVPAKWR
ncbi:MAG: NAD(+) synthase [Owenweeksia sp.]|nr:NAD(+) synthase [Owenweeksia sp.]